MTDLDDGESTTCAKGLVVGWDRQPMSTAALQCAIDLARHLNAHLHVVHVVDVDDLPVDPDASDWSQQIDADLDAGANSARVLLDRLGEDDWTYRTVHGRPPEVLADLAEEVGAVMIVLGAPRGGMHSFIDTFAGQSVSHQLARKHGRPVLLVPEPSTCNGV